MHIFLTGASGFLGSHTVEALLKRGHTLSVMVRKTSRTTALQHPAIEQVPGALPENLPPAERLEKVDAVIHIAGIVKALRPEDFFRVNGQGTENLVRLLLSLKHPPKKFIQISTIAVHSARLDGKNFCLSPESCHPVSVYGKSKLQGEKALSPLQKQMSVYILRPPVLYGPGDTELLPLFKIIRHGWAPLYGKKNPQLSICYVQDVAEAIADLVDYKGKNEIFCLDDGEVYTWKSLMDRIAEGLGKKIFRLNLAPWIFQSASWISQFYAQLTGKAQAFSPDKVKEMEEPFWVCGHSQLTQQGVWRPKTSIKEGIQKTMEDYRKRGWI